MVIPLALTEKQERFARNIVSGMTAKQAYIAAYNTKANDRVIYNESAKLLNNPAIAERLKELRKPLEAHAQSTALSEREKKRAILWDMVNDANRDDSTRLKALDLLNKMDSEYININRNIDDKKPEISGLSMEALTRLAGIQ